jgi:hypothetical protein
VTVLNKALTAPLRLTPLGIDWHEPGNARPFAGDRPTQAYFLSRNTNACAHFMSRGGREKHYGLGDKTGAFDRTGRRFKLDAVDPSACWPTSDPLYKIIPTDIAGGNGLPAAVSATMARWAKPILVSTITITTAFPAPTGPRMAIPTITSWPDRK